MPPRSLSHAVDEGLRRHEQRPIAGQADARWHRSIGCSGEQRRRSETHVAGPRVREALVGLRVTGNLKSVGLNIAGVEDADRPLCAGPSSDLVDRSHLGDQVATLSLVVDLRMVEPQ